MSSIFSPSWYRVAALKPLLRPHFEVHRQTLGNELSFLLQDQSTGKFYRFNANAYDIIGRMDGVRTTHEIWEATVACLGDEAPTQDETIALLGQMHAADALHANVTPDCLELFRRSQRNKTRWWKNLLRSPLSIRLPLLDPDRALAFMMPALGPLFSLAGFIAWLLLVVWAVFLAAAHWPELSHGAADQILDPSNLVFLALVYPLVKALHELGHAIATRKWGGEVHEMGITFLVFMPIPYVDASAASAIREKYRRIIVSAAGMMVELFLAAIALFVWLNVEPGLLRLAAFNVMLVGSVSTLLFNGNPLLRFDAYYILKDAIEIPNLAPRSTRHLAYLAQRYLLGVESVESPATRAGERGWLLFYGVASTLYRLAITFGIILFIAGKFFVIGVVLALWATATQIVLPALKMVNFVLFNRLLDQHRWRAIAVSTTVLATTLGIVFLAPVPFATHAEGVLWLPEQAHVQAGTDGVIKTLLAEPFKPVRSGQPLLSLEDPMLAARLKVLEAEVEELNIRHRIEKLGDPVQAAILKDKLAAKHAELARERERAAQLIVTSGSDGLFVLRRASDLPGRFVRQGERIGYVLDRSSMSVRVVVPQDRIGLVRENVLGVEVKLAEALSQTIAATVTRAVPAAQDRLPSRVLGSAGGGSIAVNPNDEEGLTPMQSVFQLDVTLSEEPSAWRIGQRAYVKFDHGNQPLAEQWMRLGRQLFLRRFGV